MAACVRGVSTGGLACLRCDPSDIASMADYAVFSSRWGIVLRRIRATG